MLKNIPRVLGILLGFLLLITFPESIQAQDNDPVVHVIEAEGVVAPAMAEYLDRSLEQAALADVEALIIQLDTPGGAIDAMNRMVQSIRASSVPVIVYVTPKGAMAASAGTVITVAGHLSAMAPETVIGAASPIGGQGEDLESTLERKQMETLKATVRTLMEGRPPDAIGLAEQTIEEAIAVTSREALEIGMIDIIANDLADLLEQADGRQVTTSSGNRTLSTSNANVILVRATFLEQLLATLTDPNIVFILLSIGVQAILIELGSPGGWVAGFLGAVFLTLSFYGIGLLEVNWVGFIFLVISFILFILDIKAPTHGALTAAGVASFIVGALVLFNSPGTPDFQRVSVPLVVAGGLITGGSFGLILFIAVRSQNRPVQTGENRLVGRIGKTKSDIDPSGIVQLGGEQWTAVPEDGKPVISAGSQVEVIDVRGVRLVVREVV